MSDEVITARGIYKRYAKDLRTTRRRGLSDLVGEVRLRSSARFPDLQASEFWSLEDVSFSLHRGEALGIVGANGAGKTTLLRLLHGISRPDHGEVEVVGSTGAVIQLGTSFEMQMTGRESIMLEGAVMGRPEGFGDDGIRRIMEFAEIGDFIDAPIRTYSLGMRLRLGYAIAAELNPDILLLDEELAVGDFGFQRKCMMFLHRYVAEGGSLVVVSHQLWQLRNLCARCMVLDHGKVIADTGIDEALATYTALSEERELQRVAAASASNADAVDYGLRLRQRDAPKDVEPTGSEGALGPVTVLSASLSGAGGGPALPRHPAELSVEVDSEGEAASFVWSFAISQPNQINVVVRGQSPPLAGLSPGRHILSVGVPALPLVSGSYDLRVGIFSPDAEVIGQRGLFDQPFKVEVAAQATRRETFERLVKIMAVADFDWDVPPSDGAMPGAE